MMISICWHACACARKMENEKNHPHPHPIFICEPFPSSCFSFSSRHRSSQIILYQKTFIITHHLIKKFAQASIISTHHINRNACTRNMTISLKKNDVDVLCVGEFLIDFIAEEINESLQNVSCFKKAAGGAPANVAVGVQCLGKFTSGFCGMVGNDPFGHFLQNTLKERGVNIRHLMMASEEQEGQVNIADNHNFNKQERRTTINFCSVWDDGHKELCFYPTDITDLFVPKEAMEESLLSGVQCLHYGSIMFIKEPAASAQHKLLQMAKQKDNDILLTYDVNYRPSLWPNEAIAHKVILDGFKYCHVAKISQEEWSIVVTGNKSDSEERSEAVISRGEIERSLKDVKNEIFSDIQVLIVSCGDLGAIATNGEYVVSVPATNGLPRIVDTTGAGDGFMAAMITRLLPEFKKNHGTLKNIDQQTLQDALYYACTVGGLACTKAGAIPALPTAQEVYSFMSSRLTTLPSSQMQMQQLTPERLAGMIDHTFLKPQASSKDIEKLCQEAHHYGFAMVAVNPCQVERCVTFLNELQKKNIAGRSTKNKQVGVGAAIGFPLGQNTTKIKLLETQDAIEKGATEIDMVLNVGELKAHNDEYIRQELGDAMQICKAASSNEHGHAASHTKTVTFKVILETCHLTDDEIIRACKICHDLGEIDFVKTSTGFGPQGATVQHVQLMRKTVGHTTMGVKASGGIRDLQTAKAMIAAGASRIGTSNGVAIMEELIKEIQENG